MLGRAHPTLKHLRDLRRERKLRDAEQVLLAEGIHLALEALRSGAAIELAVVSAALDHAPGGPALRAGLERATRVEEVADTVLDGLQDARSPQPVLLLLRRASLSLESVVRGRGGAPLLVIAHDVQDPGSLGSMLRSADGAGATGFLATGHGADLFHPRTVRATMGSLFRLPSAQGALDEALARSRAGGLGVVATCARGGVPHHAFDFRSPTAVVFGPEGAGLPTDCAQTADARITVPMHEGVESLSVGAAAAAILFESARQRGKRGQAPF